MAADELRSNPEDRDGKSWIIEAALAFGQAKTGAVSRPAIDETRLSSLVTPHMFSQERGRCSRKRQGFTQFAPAREYWIPGPRYTSPGMTICGLEPPPPSFRTSKAQPSADPESRHQRERSEHQTLKLDYRRAFSAIYVWIPDLRATMLHLSGMTMVGSDASNSAGIITGISSHSPAPPMADARETKSRPKWLRAAFETCVASVLAFEDDQKVLCIDLGAR